MKGHIYKAVATIAVLVISWVGATILSNKDAVASLQNRQIEDERVNKIVYELAKDIPTIAANVVIIKDHVTDNTNNLSTIRNTVKVNGIRIYCVAAFPVGNDKDTESLQKRENCVKNLNFMDQ